MPVFVLATGLAAACQPGIIDAPPSQGPFSHDGAVADDAPRDAGAHEPQDGSNGEEPGDDGPSAPDAATPDAGRPEILGRTGPSAGCGLAAPAEDTADDWVRHDLAVDGVAARFLEGAPDYGSQGGFDFAHRNYFVRLPANYDPARRYPLLFSGGGCGATSGTSGDGGGANPLPDGQDAAIQVGLSYVYTNHSGACFEDGSADTPDLPYFDAVLAELERRYCFDLGKVFVSGFSSGAWESYMLACARGGVIRGLGTQGGGLRDERPPCSGVPVAAFLTAGAYDDDDPIADVDPNTGEDHGSQAARDVILDTNGCLDRTTEPYVTDEAPAEWQCLRYTSCPAAYPVVFCAIAADGGGHGAGNTRAFVPFWSALPSE